MAIFIGKFRTPDQNSANLGELFPHVATKQILVVRRGAVVLGRNDASEATSNLHALEMGAGELIHHQPARRSTAAARQMNKIRVGIAEDHLLVQHALNRLLLTKPEYEVIGCSRTGGEALEMVSSQQLDVLILGVNMPGSGAFEVLGNISKVAPSLKVIIFSGFPEAKYGAQLRRLGACAYVDKGRDIDALFEALRHIVNDDVYFSTGVLESGIPEEARGQASHPVLTSREFQIFLRLASGDKVGEIATSLALSVGTVSNHRAALLKKLMLASNSDLTRYALVNGFLH